MHRIKLLLVTALIFAFRVSVAQKMETGVNLGIADASIRGGDAGLKKSLLGYNAGVYLEQYVLDNLGFNSAVQFIEKGLKGSSLEAANYSAKLDFIQYAFTTKIYIDEGTKNKLVVGLGFYCGILHRKKITADPNFSFEYDYFPFDAGISGLLGVKIDKYVALLIQAQMGPSAVVSGTESGGHHVYVGLNLSAPLFSFNK